MLWSEYEHFRGIDVQGIDGRKKHKVPMQPLYNLEKYLSDMWLCVPSLYRKRNLEKISFIN